MNIRAYIFSLIALVAFAALASKLKAQTPGNLLLPDSSILNSELYVQRIAVTGNNKTKTCIIEREFGLHEGDTLQLEQLRQKMEDARKRVYNLNLFNKVDLTVINLDSWLVLSLVVSEKWYLYPVPQFQLVDRNYNEWIKVHNASLKRVNFGVKFAHYNFSGRRDPLRVYLLAGYSRNITVAYSQPYSNKKLTEGFGFIGQYTAGREMSYKTSYNNKILQYAGKDFVRNQFYASANYNIRENAYLRKFISLSYTHLSIADSVLMPKYNPSYFNINTTKKGYADISAGLRYLNTNNNNYPLNGKAYLLSVTKRGLGLTGGVNMLSLYGEYQKYIPHKHNFYSSFEGIGLLKLPFDQPYVNQSAIGYLNFYIRGMEYYVIDGVAAAVGRYTLRKKLFSFHIPVPFNIRSVPSIPITFFAKTYGNIGYAYNKDAYRAMLNNRLLRTGGFGIDILTLYDMNIRLEYSFNQLGQKGLFLHSNTSF